MAITLDPNLEHYLISVLNRQGDAITLDIPPEVAIDLNNNILNAWKSAMDKAYDNVVLICDARLRPALYNMVERNVHRLPVIAYDEFTQLFSK